MAGQLSGDIIESVAVIKKLRRVVV